MEIITITEKKVWNDWLIASGQFSFTQSFEWGEILISEGKKIERLAVTDGKEIIAVAQIVFSKIFGFSYAFCPKGPIVKSQFSPDFLMAENRGSTIPRHSGIGTISNSQSNSNELISKIYETIVEYLRGQGCSFFRIEPRSMVGLPATSYPDFAVAQNRGSAIPPKRNRDKLQAIKSLDINPRATTVLDLGLSEEELLTEMHPKTRYNIRLAEKKALVLKEEKSFESFWTLMRQTGERDRFKLHDRQHYEAIFNSPLCRQLTAESDGRPVATVVLVAFGNTMTYLFGASDYEHRQKMAPHLLQWEAIKFAKKAGYKFYDFFGIAPSTNSHPPLLGEGQGEGYKQVANTPTSVLPLKGGGGSADDFQYDPQHQYAGVTRFKLGFGGEVIEQPGTYDLIISPGTYRMYEVLRKLRRLV